VKLHFEYDISADELVQSRGAWHKSCYLKFSNSKLERAKKRGNATESSTCAEKRPRREAIGKWPVSSVVELMVTSMSFEHFKLM